MRRNDDWCPWCHGRDGQPKRSYDSEVQAKQVASVVEMRRAVTLRVYECPHGTGWHLTSQREWAW
jgi:hypothetical protein